MTLGIDNPLKHKYYCARCGKEVTEKKPIEVYIEDISRFPSLGHKIYHKKCLEAEKRFWSGYKSSGGYIHD